MRTAFMNRRHDSRPAAAIVRAAAIACGSAVARASAALAAVALLFGAAIPAAASRRIPDYRAASDLLATTPSTDDGAIGALANPAQWGVLEKSELALLWTDGAVRDDTPDNWGLVFGKGFGFAVRRVDFEVGADARHVIDYQIGLGGGSGAKFCGAAFGWSGGDEQLVGRTSFFSLGGIHRPTRWLSIGTVGRLALGGGDRDAVLDVGIRPFADPGMLFFADYALTRDDAWDEGSLAGGFEVRPIDGIAASLKWDDEDRFQIGVGLTLQRFGVRAVPHFDDQGDEYSTSYAVRLNPPVRGFDIDAHSARGKRVLEMSLKGRATYQRFRFGDDESLPLRSLTEQVRFAADDPTVAGVALNLSGFEANPAMIWELRESLLGLKGAGKKIAVYCDRVDLPLYYLVSAADHVVMDPQGGALFPGVQLSRTYQKEMLAKIGVGFDEWRFFKYKSAMESYSRTSMSEADREQRQGIVNESYGELAGGIAASSRIERAALDDLVDNDPMLFAPRLLELGLVDRIGRWEEMDAAVDTLVGRDARLVGHEPLAAKRWQPDEEWGEPPVIALVYAVGECAMDEGIKGRATSKAMRGFRGDRNVKAVVLRADSPGGDPLPSDLVAHETRALAKAKKPVLVSQGRVAASGGYWISMDADTVLTSPFSITGSIGVIGGWFWNEGLGGKLGLASDRVQAGRSADLLGGLRIPILGATIPERNLDERERDLVKERIFDLYDQFTEGVARARGLEVGFVREIGEGRVYMGRPAIELGLVDRVGTLDETVEAAKRAAGIAPDRRVRVVEYPKRGFIKWPRLFSLPSISVGGSTLDEAAAEKTYEEMVLEGILESPGQPLLFAPSGLLPDEGAVVR